MNGIDKITARIEEDCQKEADAILAEAKAKAAEITARFQAQADAEAKAILERGRKDAAERERRLASVDQLECRKAVLAAKQDMIDLAFQKAGEKLRSLPLEDYVTFLAGLAEKASSTGQEKLVFSPADRARVGKKVAIAANNRIGPQAALTVAEETRPMDGGFILSSGNVEVNCTFDTLIRLQRGPLAGEVSRVLFG